MSKRKNRCISCIIVIALCILMVNTNLLIADAWSENEVSVTELKLQESGESISYGETIHVKCSINSPYQITGVGFYVTRNVGGAYDPHWMTYSNADDAYEGTFTFDNSMAEDKYYLSGVIVQCNIDGTLVNIKKNNPSADSQFVILGNVKDENQNDCSSSGHLFETSVRKATPSNDGYIKKICSKCGCVETEIIDRPTDVRLSDQSFVYTNKLCEPVITVRDSSKKIIDSSHYQISYKNNNSVGKAIAIIRFLDSSEKYIGSMRVNYNIVPGGTSINKINSTSKGFNVAWKKQSVQTSGYQICYSTSSKFTKSATKYITIKTSTALSKKVQNLKAKKAYYVKVRTYKAINRDRYYSAWSTAKKIITKK